MVCVEEGSLPLYLYRLELGLESISDGNPACHRLNMLSRHCHPKVALRGAGGGMPAPLVRPHPDCLPSHCLCMVDRWLGLGCSLGGFAPKLSR
jgi:hypothetical protein